MRLRAAEKPARSSEQPMKHTKLFIAIRVALLQGWLDGQGVFDLTLKAR